MAQYDQLAQDGVQWWALMLMVLNFQTVSSQVSYHDSTSILWYYCQHYQIFLLLKNEVFCRSKTEGKY